MRARLCFGAFVLAAVLAALLPVRGWAGPWRQIHPYYQGAYIFSFRSPDLLGENPDEWWGRADRRLVAGAILTDFPHWLAEHATRIEQARTLERPIILALHLHSGFGTGLVTYTADLRRAEVANYPWLIRRLEEAGLDRDDVTVTVDTCNAQATAAHQIRPDLVPRGVAALAAFQQWRHAPPFRRRLSLGSAFRVFAEDHVAQHLGSAARGRRANVTAAAFAPLTPEERQRFRAHLYGPKGVIIATPAFFNLLRLGPEPRGTQTADLLHDRLETRVLDGGLAQNKMEFARFREFGFLAAAGAGDPDEAPEPVAPSRVPSSRRAEVRD